jgi:hypothetical protein
MKKALLFLIVSFSFLACEAQFITTIAGDSSLGYTGDGGPATKAELNQPFRTIYDKKGNIYISDYAANVVRMVNPAGIISTVAGSGIGGYSGDGGQATNAQLNGPTGLCIDTAGNMYVADWGNNVIRKISLIGVISTFAGNGSAGYSGDSGLAVNAEFNGPEGLALDKKGNLYIADWRNNVVRMINSNDSIFTIAGTGAYGYGGDGGPATNAELRNTTDVCLDTADNIYIADIDNSVVRKVSKLGTISTYAGCGISGYSGDGGPATAALLSDPAGVCVDSKGDLFIADAYSNVIRMVTASDTIRTIAGNAKKGYSGDGGFALNAMLNTPSGVMLDDSDNIYIADFINGRIRKVTKPWLAGVNELKIKNEQLNVYPNPSHGIFTIEQRAKNESEVIEVYNVLGEKVYSNYQISKSSNYQIDLTAQPTGIYFYRVISETGTVIGEGKLIKE